jgi:cyclophilin family peptidyl-prolyl cis-trans isomerase
MKLNNKFFGITLGIVLVGAIIIFFFNSKNKVADEVGLIDDQSQSNINTSIKVEENIASSTDLLAKKNIMPIVKIQTNKGDITLELYVDDAPQTVNNFITLAKKGFYDGVIFHRVISGFMIQGGDPTGTGRGGPGYQFADELNSNTASYKEAYKRGVVAMANAGPNTNGSQFFIMHQDYALSHDYTIFGKVTAGLEVVDAIAAEKVDGSDRPLKEVVMKKVEVVE